MQTHLLACIPVEERYSTASFKTSRALRNKLASFSILSEFESFMGEFADFMNTDMPKAETVLSTMNGHAVFLENRFAGQSTELLGAVLFELCKFCVWTPRSWFVVRVCTLSCSCCVLQLFSFQHVKLQGPIVAG